ncbi:DNA polymerase III subunit [Sphingobacterium wenxiniae]|uniref:DNA polymerase-3 subunit delta n=1 Tax=Sphingobacterium wenxiniae TaxID=683125 RepID=A0A1I6SB92_9SPHI|nr:DNA polymerase III subunit delta' [Sphingobacterium wenxiniae]SFS74245.1 DNA polymerase-3 subunit delta' [Sphingobacterium wenxiniae]
MQFKEIIGHHDIKEHLLQTVKDNRVSHAQLFLGPEGSGSLALAVAYAQYINCENKQLNDSCGTCSSCRKYQKLIHPDLHFSYPFFANGEKDVATSYLEEWRKAFLENPYMGLDHWRHQLDAGNKQANINIAEAHDIIKKLSLKAFEAEYKVLIMWLPEYLNTQGNALLKLIEEPPAKTLFLLVAENQDKILNTIISRTQLVKIFKLPHHDVAQYLIQEKSIPTERANEIAFIADGNIQTALNLIAEESNEYFNLLISWLRFIVTDSGLNFIRVCEEDFPKLGRENQKNFLFYAVNMLRQIVLMQQGLQNLVLLQGQELDFVKKFSEIFQLEQLEVAIELLEKTHYKVERNANPKILFLDLSLQLVLLFKYQTFPQGAQYI